MKSCLGVKVSTQNDFVYCELGRLDMYSYAIINVIKYWVKVINSSENKYINIMYKQILHDIARYPNKQNWASQVKDILIKFWRRLDKSKGSYLLFLYKILKKELNYCLYKKQIHVWIIQRVQFSINI